MGPVETRRALLLRQRFRQHEQAVAEVEDRQSRGEPERQAMVDVAEHAADQRADDEAQAERRADHAEALRAFFRRSDVGDVGIRSREAGRGRRRDDPADEQPRQVGRQRHEHEVQAEPQAGDQDHRAPAIAIGESALDRRTEELHQRERERERTGPVRRGGGVATDELLHQVRQHRDDHPECQHVDQHGDEDEDQRGLACAGGEGCVQGVSRCAVRFVCIADRCRDDQW